MTKKTRNTALMMMFAVLMTSNAAMSYDIGSDEWCEESVRWYQLMQDDMKDGLIPDATSAKYCEGSLTSDQVLYEMCQSVILPAGAGVWLEQLLIMSPEAMSYNSFGCMNVCRCKESDRPTMTSQNLGNGTRYTIYKKEYCPDGCKCATTCTSGYTYRCDCNNGYYASKQGTLSCICNECPTHEGTSASSNMPSSITGCYISSSTLINDQIGSYKFSQNCYYSN